MSKTSGSIDTATPTYKSSTISLNSEPKSSTYFNGSQVVGNYNMSDAEKRSYDYAQNEFANNLEKLNVFSESTLKDLNDQVEAYKQQGIKTIKDVYTPILRDLQNDMAKRFGNIDNSIFLDKLSDIEDKRAESISTLAQDVTAKKQELVNNELANRYNYLNFLNDYQNQVYKNALSSLGLNNDISSGIRYTNTSSTNSGNLDAQLAKTVALLASAL